MFVSVLIGEGAVLSLNNLEAVRWSKLIVACPRFSRAQTSFDYNCVEVFDHQMAIAVKDTSYILDSRCHDAETRRLTFNAL